MCLALDRLVLILLFAFYFGPDKLPGMGPRLAVLSDSSRTLKKALISCPCQNLLDQRMHFTRSPSAPSSSKNAASDADRG